VSVGAAHTCALKAGGDAYCWGDNIFGETGVAQGDTTCGPAASAFRCVLVPQHVAPGLEFRSISAGQEHTCGITLSYDAYCWGSNASGQVGGAAVTGPALVKVPATLPWVQISAGATHTCAVRSDGVAFCWGAGQRGELGNGNFASSVVPVRAQMPGPVASVSAGDERSCGRTFTGAVYCWGAIWTTRQGGLEITRADPTPERVPAAPGMAWLSVGTFTTCGASVAGQLYCWEANPRGEMGVGSQEGSTIPETVLSTQPFVQVSAGIVQSCGIAADGAGYCWGDDSFGELGVPPSLILERCGGQILPCSTTPEPVIGLQRFIDISTGFGSHTCGVTTQGNLYCWGLGSSGQRGDGTSGGAISTPLRVVEPHASP
jgi:alpha-tubulin suppressor-like RCC1 family protein